MPQPPENQSFGTAGAGAEDLGWAATLKEFEAYLAIERALVFASYKIGTTGAAQGFLSEDALERWTTQVKA